MIRRSAFISWFWHWAVSDFNHGHADSNHSIDDRCRIFATGGFFNDFSGFSSCLSEQAILGIMIDRYDPKSLQALAPLITGMSIIFIIWSIEQQLMSGCMLLFAYGDRLGWLVASAGGYLGLGVWQALSGIGSLHCDAVYPWNVGAWSDSGGQFLIWLAVMISPCWSLRLAISPLHSCCIS